LISRRVRGSSRDMPQLSRTRRYAAVTYVVAPLDV